LLERHEHLPAARGVSQEFFRRLDHNGYLSSARPSSSTARPTRRFLADRYVIGTCPHCGYEKARGDECPRCAKWLNPLDFKDPRCKVCGTVPERRRTQHWYLDLPKLRDEFLGEWAREHEWKENVGTFVGTR
jgi:methionyl-tRNA synthetase